MEITRRLADFVVDTNISGIPSKAWEIGKQAILDCLGVALAGSLDPLAEKIVAFLQDVGGHPKAGVWGKKLKTSSPLAALANGASGHALDYDDWSRPMRGHPTIPLLPTIIAVGEEIQASGKDILEAYLLGFEVEAKLGAVLNPHVFEAGWHPTAILGSMASAAAAAKLMRLDSEKVRVALGIAASEAGGLRQNFGTMTKPLHAGLAAKNGVVAAKLAARGFTADKQILEEKFGYANAFAKAENYDWKKIMDGLGRPFEILSSGVGIKRFPSCARTHPAMDAMLALVTQNDIRPEEVESISCGGSYSTPKLLIHSRPQTALEGKFSMEFCLAIILLDRKAELSQFTDAKVRDPKAQQFIKKVTFFVREDLKTTEHSGNPSALVKVVTKAGKEYIKRVDEAKGSPTKPLTFDELKAKYQDCAKTVQNKEEIEKTIELVESLDRLKSISPLADLLTLIPPVPDPEK